MRQPWEFPGLKPADIASHLDELGECYAQHGIIVMPGLLAGDADFQRYLGAIRFLFTRIFARYTQPVEADEDIGVLLARLKEIAPLDGRIVADMGTQQNKFVAGNRLKFAEFVLKLLECVYGEEAVLATPFGTHR